MGIAVSVTPLTSHAHPVSRRKSINAVEISAAGYVQIVSPPEPRFSFNLQYKNIDILEIPDPCSNIIILWKMSLLFNLDARTNWSSMMQSTIGSEYHPKTSSVFFLQ